MCLRALVTRVLVFVLGGACLSDPALLSPTPKSRDPAPPVALERDSTTLPPQGSTATSCDPHCMHSTSRGLMFEVSKDRVAEICKRLLLRSQWRLLGPWGSRLLSSHSIPTGPQRSLSLSEAQSPWPWPFGRFRIEGRRLASVF